MGVGSHSRSVFRQAIKGIGPIRLLDSGHVDTGDIVSIATQVGPARGCEGQRVSPRGRGGSPEAVLHAGIRIARIFNATDEMIHVPLRVRGRGSEAGRGRSGEAAIKDDDDGAGGRA